MSGGLDLAVSVVTRRGGDRAPVLLEVNPETPSSYSVAGSASAMSYHFLILTHSETH